MAKTTVTSAPLQEVFTPANNSLSIIGSSRLNGDREPNDYYPTPAFVVEELLKRELFIGGIWEPACGEGNIRKVLTKNGFNVYSSDLDIEALCNKLCNMRGNEPLKLYEEIQRFWQPIPSYNYLTECGGVEDTTCEETVKLLCGPGYEEFVILADKTIISRAEDNLSEVPFFPYNGNI